jgi:hypothetical protein
MIQVLVRGKEAVNECLYQDRDLLQFDLLLRCISPLSKSVPSEHQVLCMFFCFREDINILCFLVAL